MGSVHMDGDLSRRCLRALRHLCGRTGFLPTSCQCTIPDERVMYIGDLTMDSIRERFGARDAEAAVILRQTIHSKGYRAFASSVQGHDAVDFIEMLDDVSSTHCILFAHLIILITGNQL